MDLSCLHLLLPLCLELCMWKAIESVFLTVPQNIAKEKRDVVRATAVRWDARQDAVLAGDPKVFRLLCNTNLNMNIPSRGSEEERIRIPCGYGLIYRMTDIINKTEIGKYVSVRVRY